MPEMHNDSLSGDVDAGVGRLRVVLDEASRIAETLVSTGQPWARVEPDRPCAPEVLGGMSCQDGAPNATCLNEGCGTDAVFPLTITGKLAVSVRASARTTVVAFPARLARELDLPSYSYASIRRLGGRVVFTFTNDGLSSEGTFALAYDGGAARQKGSPARIIQLRRGGLMLEHGMYRPTLLEKTAERTRISIDAGGQILR